MEKEQTYSSDLTHIEYERWKWAVCFCSRSTSRLMWESYYLFANRVFDSISRTTIHFFSHTRVQCVIYICGELVCHTHSHLTGAPRAELQAQKKSRWLIYLIGKMVWCKPRGYLLLVNAFSFCSSITLVSGTCLVYGDWLERFLSYTYELDSFKWCWCTSKFETFAHPSSWWCGSLC